MGGPYRGIGVPKSTPADVKKRLSDLWHALSIDPEMRDLAAKIQRYTEGAKRLGLGM
ncbi:MAG: hypothetical protein ABI831_25490 [Betaproteobacteria bacterium]